MRRGNLGHCHRRARAPCHCLFHPVRALAGQEPSSRLPKRFLQWHLNARMAVLQQRPKRRCIRDCPYDTLQRSIWASSTRGSQPKTPHQAIHSPIGHTRKTGPLHIYRVATAAKTIAHATCPMCAWLPSEGRYPRAVRSCQHSGPLSPLRDHCSELFSPHPSMLHRLSSNRPN